MSDGAPVLRATALVKRFGATTAVAGLDLEVRRGEVVGLLGPNGAGKSTTIGMVLGLVRPTAGTAQLLGRDVAHDGDAVLACGALLEVPGLYPYLSGRDNLRALAILRGRAAAERVEPLLTRVGLLPAARRKVRTYSLGMRQRLGVAAALLGDPALVILDEPTNGLDPAGQREIRGLLRELADEGRGVLLASHLLYEVEQVCDRVVVMNRGKVVASGTVDEIVRRESGYRIEVDDPERAAATLRRLDGVRADVRQGHVEVVAEAGRGAALNRALAETGLYASAITPLASTLEEAFLEITAEQGGAANAPPA